MTGGVGEGQIRAGRQVFDTALSLAEMLQELQAMRIAERLRDLGKAGKNRLFGSDS